MATLPVEVYEILEEKFGKEDAKSILHALEKSLSVIEEKAKEEKEIAKIQIKQELTNELITKGEFQSEVKRLGDLVQSETKRLEDLIRSEVKRLEDKMDIMQKLILLGFGGFLIPMLLILIKLYFR